ncbi:acyl carrier protein [Pseudoalteromonas sp. J010]|uniref:acyl carrier protein n=1 Tax=Pseudoalteromonas sp. J010 TaxID=998465 RepID=UPI000F652C92|nr:acyl carrier protein [Pseudoalteromonas sp. J010]RRS10439.1 acyl carrier protein [Pseudoalteromonas sp. J010]
MEKQDIFNIITRNLSEVIPDLEGHPFQLAESMRDFGANSIDRSEIIMMTLEKLGISVPLIELAKAQSMGDLAGILHEKL